MTPERLDAILAAYGARPERWPAAERAAALALIAANPASARRQEVEARLDGLLLDRDPFTAPHGALVGRILASAPQRKAATRWWAGLGFAAAGLAGVAAGAMLLPLAAPHLPGHQPVEDPVTLFTPLYGEAGS